MHFSFLVPKKSRFEDKGNTPKAGQQIFDHESAAFQILCNEMIILLKKAKTESSSGSQCQFACSAIDDSLYQWRVFVGGFPVDHPLSSDLAALKSKFGYDTIELQLVSYVCFAFLLPREIKWPVSGFRPRFSVLPAAIAFGPSAIEGQLGAIVGQYRHLEIDFLESGEDGLRRAATD